MILDLLKRFFGYDSIFHGAQMLSRLLNGTDWKQTGHFPRITHCDVNIRAFGTDRKATVQCTLFYVSPANVSLLPLLLLLLLRGLARLVTGDCSSDSASQEPQ